MIHIKREYLTYELTYFPNYGCLRVGIFQVAWGWYNSTSSGSLPWVNFAKSFKDTNYSLIAHPVYTDVRVACYIDEDKEASRCRVQTYGVTNGRSGVNGQFIAFGRWA